MIKESLDEYKIICGSIDSEYSSILRYSTTAVAISSAAFAVIIKFLNGDDNGILLPYVVALGVVVNVTLLIQIIINYKCSSYNRMVGYRNLISSEKFADEDEVEEDRIKRLNLSGRNSNNDCVQRDISGDVTQSAAVSGKRKVAKCHCAPAVSYDVCMDHLNHTYAQQKFDFELVKGRFFIRKGVFQKLDQHDDQIDRFVARAFPFYVSFPGRDSSYGQRRHDRRVNRNFFCALLVLVVMMLGLHSRGKGSWKFPELLNRIILYIVAIELSWIIYVYFTEGDSYNDSITFFFLLQMAISIFLMYQVSVYWQELSFGGKRAFSYFVQFIPFRMIYLRESYGADIHPYYIGNPWGDAGAESPSIFADVWLRLRTVFQLLFLKNQ